MKNGSSPASKLMACEVLAGANWNRTLPELLRGARHYLRALGWAEGRAYRPSPFEERELVNAGLLPFLSPDKPWPEGVTPDEDGIVSVISKTMFRIAMREHQTSGRFVAAADAGHRVDDEEAPSPSQNFAKSERIERIRSAFADDREALTVIDEYVGGRVEDEDLEKALGASRDQVKVVKRRMLRRFEAGRAGVDGPGRDDGTS